MDKELEYVLITMEITEGSRNLIVREVIDIAWRIF